MISAECQNNADQYPKDGAMLRADSLKSLVNALLAGDQALHSHWYEMIADADADQYPKDGAMLSADSLKSLVNTLLAGDQALVNMLYIHIDMKW